MIPVAFSPPTVDVSPGASVNERLLAQIEAWRRRAEELHYELIRERIRNDTLTWAIAGMVQAINKDPEPEEGTWVTLRQASEHTGYCYATLCRWQRDGVVPSRIRAGHVVVRVEDLIEKPPPKRGFPAKALGPHEQEDRHHENNHHA